jgi:thiamine pyrophosphate-dependent acetolactate synthase large subunit-like protein
MGATREWQKLSDSPLDFHYLPSAMGHAPMIALGIALARPDCEVVILNGDGSLLMSLGCLVTIAACRPANLSILVLDNGVYEVTGGQSTAGARARVDYAAVARGAGFPTAEGFDELAKWEAGIAPWMRAPSPRLASLSVEPLRADYVPQLKAPLTERVANFRTALHSSHPSHSSHQTHRPEAIPRPN